MMRFVFALLILTSLGNFVVAEEVYRRPVGFDWDPIPETKGYDMEIKMLKDGNESKTFNFKINENSWSGKLSPGQYQFRVRARDYRNVPGDWSPFNPFVVGLENVRLKSPGNLAQIQTKAEKTSKVNFSWEPVGAATTYKFELNSKDGATTVQQELKETEIELEIPVASAYTWKVSAANERGLTSDGTTVAEFSTLGKKLEAPEVSKPENKFVRQLQWKKPEFAEKYDLALSRYNSKLKKWERMQDLNDHPNENIDFDAQLPGGKWKLQVRAKAQGRESSNVSTIQFDVAGGDRSPAAEYVATVRKSIDRINGWFGTASYFLTLLDYRSLLQFSSAIGGTGRLGLGWFSEKSAWGFHSVIDMSGFLADGKNYTYSSVEALAVYRRQLWDTDEIRISSGVAIRELPILLTPEEAQNKYNSQITGTSYSQATTKMSAMGPRLGLEYWHSLTPKLGLQLNSQFFYSLMKGSLPTGGQENHPALSYQMGLLGSYRLNPRLTGLMGITYREDNLVYTDNYAITANQLNIPTEITTTIKGMYLSFFAEYSF